MKFEFNQGVPRECTVWLWENVGSGNISRTGHIRRNRIVDDNWFYERIVHEIPSKNPAHDSGTRYVPTIFIENEKHAIMFALRWL